MGGDGGLGEVGVGWAGVEGEGGVFDCSHILIYLIVIIIVNIKEIQRYNRPYLIIPTINVLASFLCSNDLFKKMIFIFTTFG